MEPENTPLEKEKHRPKPPFLGFQPLVFGDVFFLHVSSIVFWEGIFLQEQVQTWKTDSWDSVKMEEILYQLRYLKNRVRQNIRDIFPCQTFFFRRMFWSIKSINIYIYIYIGYIPYKTFDQNDLVNLYLVWLRLVPWLVKVSALVG